MARYGTRKRYNLHHPGTRAPNRAPNLNSPTSKMSSAHRYAAHLQPQALRECAVISEHLLRLLEKLLKLDLGLRRHHPERHELSLWRDATREYPINFLM